VVEVWREALGIIADHGPMTWWVMSNGAVFWWTPGRSQLGADRFTEEPFGYDEIVSVTVFDVVRAGREVLDCDWPSLRGQLLGVRGLRVEELRDVRRPPASPPNQALHLTPAP
jgi:hypothetical protein